MGLVRVYFATCEVTVAACHEKRYLASPTGMRSVTEGRPEAANLDLRTLTDNTSTTQAIISSRFVDLVGFLGRNPLKTPERRNPLSLA